MLKLARAEKRRQSNANPAIPILSRRTPDRGFVLHLVMPNFTEKRDYGKLIDHRFVPRFVCTVRRSSLLGLAGRWQSSVPINAEVDIRPLRDR